MEKGSSHSSSLLICNINVFVVTIHKGLAGGLNSWALLSPNNLAQTLRKGS